MRKVKPIRDEKTVWSLKLATDDSRDVRKMIKTFKMREKKGMHEIT